MTFKISVVMPVYNAEKELNAAIDSIINQSLGFENIELIIVDDCSTDNSRNIISDYANEYDNIVPVFLDENSGLPGKPRSLGIKHASADYISFLDSDDEYLKEGLENLYNTILTQDSDFVIGSHIINLDGDKVKVKFLQSDERLVNLNPLESQEIFDSLSLNYFVAPWGKIFKKELILDNNISFPEDTLCEDTYFYFKALINSNKISVLPNTQVYMYNTFEHKKTAIHGHDIKKFNRFLKGMYNVNDLLEPVKLSQYVTIGENIGSLLLIFSNLDKSHKMYAVKEIYKFEKHLNCKIDIHRREIAVLNNKVLNKQFKQAIFISKLYTSLYNNQTIKNLYRKFNIRKNN